MYRLAERLAGAQGKVDGDILFTSVILHDIARKEEDMDTSGQTDHALLGAQRAERLLIGRGWDPERAARVAQCVRTHRYRSRAEAPQTIEAKILFDADKLDCLGAVGVGRMFMLSGQYGEQLYIEPSAGFGEDGAAPHILNFAQYSPNLEYSLKMRHIPNVLFTDAARELAGERMARMDRFFNELRQEILE